jgi:hypothetical protein
MYKVFGFADASQKLNFESQSGVPGVQDPICTGEIVGDSLHVAAVEPFGHVARQT